MWRRDPEKYQEWLRKQRDAEKPKFLYQDMEDESDDEPELEDIANEIREEQNCIQILKWLKSQFVKASTVRGENPKETPDDFSLQPPIEIKSDLDKEVFVRLLKHLEIKIPSSSVENMTIPGGIFDFGLRHHSETIQFILDDFIISDPKNTKCQICEREFSSMLQHLNKSPKCKAKYSDSDLDDLKHVAKLAKKNSNRDYYEREKDRKAADYQERKVEIAKKNKLKKAETAIKKAEYYSKNKSTLKTKSLQYYAKNRDKINEKRRKARKNREN